MKNPDFFGYIPSKARRRAVVFFCLMALSALLLLARAATVVLLGSISSSLAMTYILGDFGLYFLYKYLRGDFFYWLNISGPLELVISILVRTVVKVCVDFTGVVHFRHPNEIGGFYWAIGACLTIVSLPLAIICYDNSDFWNETISQNAWFSFYIATPVTLILFLSFFLNIEKSHRSTFWSLKRGVDVTLSHMDSDKDEIRALVFIKNRRHWKKIEGKVETWVRGKWEQWMEEEPEWLTQNIKDKIPAYMIPEIEAESENFEKNDLAKGSSSGGGSAKVMPEEQQERTVRTKD